MNIQQPAISGSLTVECFTAGTGNGMHARCKSTRALCACRCHIALEVQTVLERQALELALSIETQLTALVERLQELMHDRHHSVD